MGAFTTEIVGLVCLLLLGLMVIWPCLTAVAQGTGLHLNPASKLPPVDCPLLISVQGHLLQAVRPSFAEHIGDDLEYELTGGGVIVGRFPWTYP